MIVIGILLIVSMVILFAMSSKTFSEIQDIAAMQRESLEKYKKRRDRYIKSESVANTEALKEKTLDISDKPTTEDVVIAAEEKKLTEGETVDHGY